MDAVKRATFHEQSLELHCTPDIDQALLEQLADVFGDIIRVERLPKLTCRGCTIIRIELGTHSDLIDFNEYIQSCIRGIYPKIPPAISPQDEERMTFETQEQARRIKVNGLHSSQQEAYNHFKTYGGIEYCVGYIKNSTITICYFDMASKNRALNNESGDPWMADVTIRNRKNERNGKWGPCPLCQRRINLRQELLISHTEICYAEAMAMREPIAQAGIFSPLQLITSSNQDLEDISDSESCFAESTTTEFCAIPHEYRNTTNNMGRFSSHF